MRRGTAGLVCPNTANQDQEMCWLQRLFPNTPNKLLQFTKAPFELFFSLTKQKFKLHLVPVYVHILLSSLESNGMILFLYI